ncbi:hypothetical protein RI129_008335 [Pyrocoelia pectoralis]|uniref:Sodium-coupled monocarboxylate transporter 1 n=1 Tax=Pyrocoelia pectoralis TaxID=417401 RepID=A0AAN7VB13_9COLE
MDDISSNMQVFSWVDYILFSAMLGISTLIGIYFGFFGKKQKTANDYLLGGRQMCAIPIAISLLASKISTTTFLVVPADIYRYGANYIWLSLATVFVAVIAHAVYLPVYFKLQLTSMFQYLHLRFDRKLRILASFFGILSMLVFCPIVIYVPALAFSQVTGVNVQIIATLTSLICVFYTTVGGLKAVVWTDVFQFIIMIATFVIIFIMGLSSVGGFGEIWSRSLTGSRLEVLDFSFDPTLRDSFGALLIGGTFQWVSFTVANAGAVQKFLCVPTFKDVKKVIIIYTISMIFLHMFATFMGLLLYARHWNCDPLASRQISRLEQLMPKFVMEITGSFTGFPGIFIAAVFSAGLSSLSACLNAMAGVIHDDFIFPFMPKDITQEKVSRLLKLIVIVTGVVSTSLVLALDKVNGIYSLYVGLMAISTGPLLGIFTLGMLFPSSNSNGTFYGSLLNMVIIAWISIENQWHQTQGLYKQYLKPISTEGCNHTFPTLVVPPSDVEQPFLLYKISFWFYTLIGCVLTIISGLVISYFTRHDKSPVPKELLSPVVYPFLRRKKIKTDYKIGMEMEEIPLKQ